ncbi:glutamyl-trna synthetase [Venturia nashicola]|uniref:Glutamate--tRNA ligase, mitochondrial n=1 Tax=Venturia nashicola TaxID=86259 RepID=A0A4Z1P3A5_9PEZI|nr:glutamyl-trna synthetase [Venturia nashicola]
MIRQLTKGRFVCHSCRISLSKLSKRRISSDISGVPPPNGVPLPTPHKHVPTSPTRTRFAPSPTGDLHLGSLRTALYNYLIAKRTGGQFILRIEDTDTKRTVPGAEERIYRDLRWAGLEWDEGPEIGGPYGPYRQSERGDLYLKHANQLLEDGHAYRCFCNAERLNIKARLEGQNGGFGAGGYDRTCHHVSKEESDDRAHQGQSFVVRLKAKDNPFTAKDLTYVSVKLPQASGGQQRGKFRDPVLLKADGLPTYHFANVVDDHYMEITHVIRGAEWLISTPLHLELYKALGWKEPAWCHVGLLLDSEGAKLSKRDQAFNMEDMKRSGVLPEALANFLVLLGWSHSDRSDFKTLKQLESEFTLKFSKGNPTVAMGKLDYLSPRHAVARVEAGGSRYEEMLDLVVDHVRTLCQSHADNLLPDMTKDEETQRRYIDAVLRLDTKNYKSALEFVTSHAYMFLRRPEDQVYFGRHSLLTFPSFATWEEQEQLFRDRLAEQLEPLTLDSAKWTRDGIIKAIGDLNSSLHAEFCASGEHRFVGDPRLVLRAVWQHLRTSVCFGRQGPSVVEPMLLLGSDIVLDRIRNVKAVLGEEKSAFIQPKENNIHPEDESDGSKRIKKDARN